MVFGFFSCLKKKIILLLHSAPGGVYTPAAQRKKEEETTVQHHARVHLTVRGLHNCNRRPMENEKGKKRLGARRYGWLT